MKSCSALVILIASAFLLPTSANAADDEVDIVGLRLGMTIDEAQQAIRAHNPDLTIQPPVQNVIRYRVGNKTHTSDPFVSHIQSAPGTKQKESIYVWFSAPPGEPRAIAIRRSHSDFEPPIPRSNYHQALLDKYGEPSATQKDTHADSARRTYWYQWHVGDGKVQCIPAHSGGRDVEGTFGTLSENTVEKGEVLTRIRGFATAQMRATVTNNPSDCAALLTYRLNFDPLTSATGTLIDVAGAMKSEQGLSTWIEDLVRKQEEATRGSSAAPKL
jgi:hypothetical protein